MSVRVAERKGGVRAGERGEKGACRKRRKRMAVEKERETEGNRVTRKRRKKGEREEKKWL